MKQIITNLTTIQQGALTHGDRRATETRDLSRFNFDNKVRSFTLIFR